MLAYSSITMTLILAETVRMMVIWIYCPENAHDWNQHGARLGTG